MEKELKEILNKYLEVAYVTSGKKIPDKYQTFLVAAMKEFGDLVVDKCASKATTKCISGVKFIKIVDKDSILKVKELIK